MAKLISLVICVLLAAATTLAEDKLTITPSYDELLIKIGATQELNCVITTKDDTTELVWTVNGDALRDEISKNQNKHTVNQLTIHNSTLTINHFAQSDAGKFKCSLLSNGVSQIEKIISLSAVTENKTEPVFVKDMTTATLSCNISFDSDKTVGNVSWSKASFKNNVEIIEPVSILKDTSRFTADSSNNSLIIDTPTLDDAGVYVARFNFSNSSSYDCRVDFQAKPFVQDFEKSKNLIEGDKMDLQCTVKGYPHSDVTWYKDNKPLHLNITEENSRYQFQKSLNGHQTARLIILSVDFSDEGVYTCQAYSARFNETAKKTVMVSVKDKLAALWPFLGIVGEVVVLCTIIFIYEQRRNKQVQLEEKAAEEVDGSTTDKKEGLRHRTGNNPTA